MSKSSSASGLPSGSDVTIHAAGEPGSAIRGADRSSVLIPLEDLATRLARSQVISNDVRGSSPFDHLDNYESQLRRAYEFFVHETETHGMVSGAAEWLLDNYYVVQQALRQIEEDMPKGYYRQLPKLKTPEARGASRIYILARELIDYGDGQLDMDWITRFISAYQKTASLTMGELWALPTMLRLSVIERLAGGASDVTRPQKASGQGATPAPSDLATDKLFATGILNLRLLAAQDWKVFFETVSRVEATLRHDPADVYAIMDFETRDRYRKVVEDLARSAGWDEQEVAREAIRLAETNSHNTERPRAAHVGYYLLDAGCYQLEALLGYRPNLRVRAYHWLLDHPLLTYLAAIFVPGLLMMAIPVGYAAAAGGTLSQVIAAALLSMLPVSAIAVTIANLLVTYTLPPRVLPKLDLSTGIPPDLGAVVVIPALLPNKKVVKSLLQQLELHYLSNAGSHLRFALLTDFTDAPQAHTPDDGPLVEQITLGIEALNQKYGQQDYQPFYLFHRDRQWNPAEDCWMGWERKRGKLSEFNRLLLGAADTSFTIQVGDVDPLREVRYVITLDSDTVLPRGGAQRLVATLAHPLNQAEFDPTTGAVTAGYTLLQPRVEIKPSSANRSVFSRVFSGDTGVDLYTLAVSDVYQDLFGEGIFVGKGIYDVRAFERSLAGRVPDNALLSHDLFEGVHGRAALVTDVTLFEEYPPNYLTQALRLHRWVRGDWQLLPWLFPRVPHAGAGSIPNSLSAIDRWKIFDNLRRSLVAPGLFAIFIAGWLWLPGSILFWTLWALLASAMPLITNIGIGLAQRLREGSLAGGDPIRPHITRWLLTLAFLPYEAPLMLDAITTTFARLLTRRHLLQWTTTAHSIRLFGRQTQIMLWQQMVIAPVIAVGLAVLISELNPPALPIAAPFLFGWLVSPQIANWIGRSITRQLLPLSTDDRLYLRHIARRTWLYFEQFVGPDDHWLPPDHFQEKPHSGVAHVTSPTNIGLLLLSTLAAHDLGYINPMDLLLRLSATCDSLGALEQYRGHFLNWYDTQSLKPLPPQYVSTVDSGNLAACLLALRQGVLSVPREPVWRWARWQGLLDTVGVLSGILEGMEDTRLEQARDPLRSYLKTLSKKVLAQKNEPSVWAALLVDLIDGDQQTLKRMLVSFFEAGSGVLDAATARSLRIWAERVQYHLLDMQSEMELFLPWLQPMSRPPTFFTRDDLPSDLILAWGALATALPVTPSPEEIREACKLAERQLAYMQDLLQESDAPVDQLQEAREWCAALADAMARTRFRTGALLAGYQNLSAQADAFFQRMDFGFLFDMRRQVFHLGYNVTSERLDGNHYDLLASEARTAGLVAIAKGDVPQSHWLYLDRTLTRVDNQRALLSWNGSMFEYLMPPLLMRSYEGTLLDQTYQTVVQRQIAYARQAGIPWGMSESGYYRFDASMNYQYRGFGVPGLGLKRGLSEDLVVSPYASLLALSVDPHAVVRNLAELADRGFLGDAGFYEAIDFTPSRLTLGHKDEGVFEYMAHHQGMSLLALVNYLLGDVMIHRFHADPRVQSVELLLQEQVPAEAPVQELPEETVGALRPTQTRTELGPWQASPDGPLPQVHFLSNGRYGVMVTGTGGGYSTWQNVDLTRWRSDTTLDEWGTWVYLQDRDSGALWSASYAPTSLPDDQEVRFYPHKAEFRRRDHGVSLRMEVAVAPTDDVEIRRINLTNSSSRFRHLSLSSYGEVILAPQGTDQRHQAFNKLFIESEYLPDLNALLFRRRPRSSEESPVYLLHMLVVERGIKVTGAHETDRAKFIGRGQTPRTPHALEVGGDGCSSTSGATLDPVMAIAQEIDLKPYATTQVAYITLAADTREGALALAGRYQSLPNIRWAFEQARAQSGAELRQLGLGAVDLGHIQNTLSALLYPHAALRARPEIIAANTKGQSGLWPYAISGDYPILLVRVSSTEEISLLREIFRAHAYWRNRHILVDLVILNQRDVGYSQELNDQIHRLITLTNSDGWLNRRGGIFLLNANQLNDADRNLLLSAARVILDGGRGSLSRQVAPLFDQPVQLPRFVPTRPRPMDASATPPIARPPGLAFDNGLGGFSPDGTEYVIYLEPGQWTPAPWINVIANPRFGFTVSEAGSGYTWAGNSSENRLTPWRNDPVSDSPGEALYIRDEETAEVWSPTPLPSRAPAPYLVRHGAGYSIFEHQSHGLRQQTQLFAAPDAPVKIVKLRLENMLSNPRRITATYYAEWVLGAIRDDTQQYIALEFEPGSHALLARNPYREESGGAVAFLAASKEPHGLTTSRAEFLGRNGSLARPAALERIGLAGTVQSGLDPCAAIQLHFDLPPGGTEEVFFILGEGENRDEALRLIDGYQDAEQVGVAWQAVGELWDGLLGAITVQTPDPAMNLMLNRWLLYQSISARIWGRTGLYQSSGAFGFRDQLQDSMGLLYSAPDMARSHIIGAARHQFDAGDVLHWWHPPSGRGVRTRISDDLLWLPLVVAHYVNITGDESILSEKITFLKGAPLKPEEVERYARYEISVEKATLYEHACRALDKGATSGPNGLPLMGSGDWNDGMNRVGIEGRGESVWLGWFLYTALIQFAPLCERAGDSQRAAAYRKRAADLLEAVAGTAWDGGWYRRATYDDGSPLGSAANRECQIDSIPQSWAVIAAMAADAPRDSLLFERAVQAMSAVAERLVRPDDDLILLFAPPFNGTVRDPGYIKGYPPGIRENGGQYTHAAIWAVWAFAELGQGDHAMALFQMLNPINHADTLEKALCYRVEPFVIAADVYGVEPHVGRGGWTWYTGSAGWMYRLGLEQLLGFHRSGDTLRIDPCIPGSWPGFHLTYRDGTTTYAITVVNPDGVNQGVNQVSMDGDVLPEGKIPLHRDGKNHVVHILMGE